MKQKKKKIGRKRQPAKTRNWIAVHAFLRGGGGAHGTGKKYRRTDNQKAVQDAQN